jgi:subtilase family serine protease
MSLTQAHAPAAFRWLAWPLGLCLAACGGGDRQTQDAQAGPASAGTLSISLQTQAMPHFHQLPAELPPPVSGSAVPTRVTLSALEAGIPTSGLTREAFLARRDALRTTQAQAATAAPMATTSAVVYNPAQIRAAYGLTPLPASWTGLSATQLADYGVGQTVYVLDAYAYSNVLSDLNAFSARFGLPSCRSVPAGTGTPGLLAAPAAQGCDFMQAYPDASGKLLATAPAYNAGWAGETALDVQWAHAIAPLARIVLLSARDANTNSLAGGVMAANRMGPGVLSMSFGAAEGSWTAQMEPLWSHPGITYVASTGDSGTQVNWPAVSPKVLAVGGTTLSYAGSGSRTEVAWSGAGGGISAYTALPAYQAGLSIAGVQTAPRRTTSDVSFNADPYSGQYTAFTAPGGSTTWGAYAGTSIAAPQWAGLLAVANAKRIAKGRPGKEMDRCPSPQCPAAARRRRSWSPSTETGNIHRTLR